MSSEDQAFLLSQLRSVLTVCVVYMLAGLTALCIQLESRAQTFIDVTAGAGINHTQIPGPPGPFSDRMSGGATAADFNGDGWIDLFATRMNGTDMMYMNNGNGTFTDVSAGAGFTIPTKTNGAAAGDIDNDGDLDLYVTSVFTDQYYLYINDGLGGFTEQAVARNADVDIDPAFSGSRRGNSVSFGDYDRDGYLDIHTNDWGHRLTPGGEVPDSYTGARLLRNLGGGSAGYFEDTTLAAGVSLATDQAYTADGTIFKGVWSFSSRFVDIDKDGWDDLLVAGDFHSSRLFWNNGDGTFSDGTATSGVATDENGMGSAVGDYDGDGDYDWFVTSIHDPNEPCDDGSCTWDGSGNRLYRYDGNRQFSDQTDSAGVRDGGWGWGAVWLDYDNDGDLDLSMTNGVDFLGYNDPADEDYQFNTDQMRLWRNDGAGSFTEVATAEGLTDTGSGKALLSFDYDNDGDLDLFNVNNIGAPVLYRNDTINTSGSNGNAWLKIETVGNISNKDGIGAQIVIDPNSNVAGDEIYRDVNGGSHYLAQSDMTVHVGLGNLAGTIDSISITWPSGYTQEFTNVSPNQLVTITEGLLADFDNDDDVDGSDLAYWSSNYGMSTGATRADGDADGDGDVDGEDFLLWQMQHGMSVSSGMSLSATITSVPEPTSAVLFVSISLLHAGRRRKI